jgi:hypothetical protein
VSAVEQIREVVRLTGRLTEDDVESMATEERDLLTATFRELHPRE